MATEDSKSTSHDAASSLPWLESIAQIVIFYSIGAVLRGNRIVRSGLHPRRHRLLAVERARHRGVLHVRVLWYRWHTKNRLRYPFSMLAMIDLLAILPFYLGLAVDLRLRLVRTLRILRLFKLYRYNTALQNVMHGIPQSQERAGRGRLRRRDRESCSARWRSTNSSTSPAGQVRRLSDAVWWSFVTLTTVGYGDLIRSRRAAGSLRSSRWWSASASSARSSA